MILATLRQHLMTDEERAELLQQGWQPDVIQSLYDRGFRPCQPDFIMARTTGMSPSQYTGFIRQTCTPHIHISIHRDEVLHGVLEHIDSAIYQAGHCSGHDYLAAYFMRFFEACKNHPTPDTSDLAARIANLESQSLKVSESPSLPVSKSQSLKVSESQSLPA